MFLALLPGASAAAVAARKISCVGCGVQCVGCEALGQIHVQVSGGVHVVLEHTRIHKGSSFFSYTRSLAPSLSPSLSLKPELDLQGRLPLLPPVKPIPAVVSVVAVPIVGIRPLIRPLPCGTPLLVARPVPRIGVRLV